MKLGASVIALVAVIVLGPRLLDGQTWTLVRAMAELGPVAGWRCVRSPTYVYDPNQEVPDSKIVAAPPERTVLAVETGMVVDSVEVNLRSGDALVDTHVAGPAAWERILFVLSPGRMTTTSYCNTSLADWQIIGEQHVG